MPESSVLTPQGNIFFLLIINIRLNIVLKMIISRRFHHKMHLLTKKTKYNIIISDFRD